MHLGSGADHVRATDMTEMPGGRLDRNKEVVRHLVDRDMWALEDTWTRMRQLGLR